MPTHTELANFIWSVADLLRGDYKQSEYGKVILPFTVLRRLDCVMAPTREAVWAKDAAIKVENRDAILYRAAGGLQFYNLSGQDFATIGADPANVTRNLVDYYNGFSASAREILDKYDFHLQVSRLHSAGLLYKVVQRFADIDLSPKKVDNHQMGYVFEELIRKFSEISNETAGEHFTPREVIELMVNLLLAPDADTLNQPGQVINILDPACGTGGMLSAAEEHITALNPHATVALSGQEVNAESYAICRSDMLIKGQNPSNIVLGNSFSNDGHRGLTFDYMLANPPFGVEWKKVQDEVTEEFKALGHAGRFGAGLPRIDDGSFLFLQHMISKMKRGADGGTRLAIVFNGSPLFSGGAGSGESEIRRWILENDWLEAIVALPDQLFYNTGISTYFWIVTNRKTSPNKGKVILLDVRDYWAKMPKSLGDKRKFITREQIAEITQLYDMALTETANPQHSGHARVKVFANEEFGYQRITVDRPLRQRFEITEDTLGALGEAKPLAKPLAKHPQVEALIGALKPFLGTVWPTKRDARSALDTALSCAGLTWPATAVDKAIWDAIAITDPDGEIQTNRGAPVRDPDLRNYENVPLSSDIDEYFGREVLPHVPDAWISEIRDKNTDTMVRAKVGYEISFTRHFYIYESSRPLSEIDAELHDLQSHIQTLLTEVTKERQIGRVVSSIRGETQPGIRAPSGLSWLGPIPASWPVASVFTQFDVQLGKMLNQDRVSGSHMKPYLRNINVQWDYITTDDLLQMDFPPRERKRYEVLPGDLLICEGGEPGRAAIWNGAVNEIYYQKALHRVRSRGRSSVRWLYYCLQAAAALNVFAAEGNTTTIAHLTGEQLRALKFPFPDRQVQDRIVAELDELSVANTAAVKALDAEHSLLEERKRALITAAIAGQADLMTARGI